MARTSTSIFRGGLQNGVTTKSVAGSANVTLTADEANNRKVTLNGALTGNITVFWPVVSEDDGLEWVVRNATTGAFKLGIAGPGGVGVEIPQGTTARMEWTGSAFSPSDVGQLPQRNDRRYVFERFLYEPVTSKRLGGAATGATGDRNQALFPNTLFEWHVKGTQTILTPILTANGWDIGMDQTAADGIELTNGITARSPVAFVVGTDAAFQFNCKLKVEDASGANPLIIGFRKAEAYQAVHTDYADYAAIGIVGTANPNTIQTLTETAGGGTTTTDTTNTWADAAEKELTVKVAGNGAVTYQIDGAAPTVVAAFSFAAAAVVVPFLYFLQAADLAGTVEVSKWECGFQSAIN